LSRQSSSPMILAEGKAHCSSETKSGAGLRTPESFELGGGLSGK
jgi:hypothetical protein